MGISLGVAGILLAWQPPEATVTGTVRDELTGAPLAQALVVLSDLDRSALTDAMGRYLLRQVPPGPQHVVVRAIGYEPRTLHALVPREGQLRINVSLRPDPVRLPTIELRRPVVIRGLDSAAGLVFPDRALSMAAVRNHPLLPEPDVLQSLGGGMVALQPETPNGIHVRGGGADQTAFLLDGIPVLNPYHAAGVYSAWNADALTRIELASAAPSPSYPDALSGAIVAETRTPSPTLHVQGTVSTTHAGVVVDGPIGSGIGYLVSLRSSYPGFLAPEDEGSYLGGATGDWLAKIEAPALGGKLRLLGLGSESELTAAARVTEEPSSGAEPRNVFEWSSRSLGAEWQLRGPNRTLRLVGWGVTGDASSAWTSHSEGPIDLAAARRDLGMLATLELRSARATTSTGLRISRSRTSYRVDPDPGAGTDALDARTPVAAAFAQHARSFGEVWSMALGLSLAATEEGVHPGPRAQLRWSPAPSWRVSGSYARLHQFIQSLRNPESVVGNVFPADLWIGVGAPGIPVARSDQGVIAAEHAPRPGWRLAAQAYLRHFDGLVLVAPRSGDPFATEAFAIGSGEARGASAEVSFSGARHGLVASYGLQRVRLRHGDSSYIPHYGTTHLLEGGLIVFPSATSSIRLAVAGALGRRATAFSGAFEWEACNLLDRGCEFGGSPSHTGQPLGGAEVPAYVRVDLGVRKHWHLEVGGRDLSIALFGTVTNLLDRANTLTYGTDPVTGEPVAVEMRPRAPLLVGLDWRF